MEPAARQVHRVAGALVLGDLGHVPGAAVLPVVVHVRRLTADATGQGARHTLFVGGRDTTLPVLIWGRVQRSVDPSLNALATTLLVATTILALLAARRTTVKL